MRRVDHRHRQPRRRIGLEGVDEDRDVQVGPWLRRVARRLADSTGAGVIIIDHSTKAKDNPLFPSGSKRKRAAITGASYHVEAVAPRSAESADEKLRVIARAAIRAAKNADRPLSGRELEELMNVKASAQRKRAGIDYAL